MGKGLQRLTKSQSPSISVLSNVGAFHSDKSGNSAFKWTVVKFHTSLEEVWAGNVCGGNEQERRYKNWSVCSASEAVRDDKNRWERNLPFIELSHGAGWWVNRKVKSNTKWWVVWQNPTNDALGTKKKRFTCSYGLRVGDRSSQLGKPNAKLLAQWIR